MSRMRLLRDRRGVTIVEFALIAPVFLIALFGLLEGARMLWTTQALNEAAYSTARCRLVAGTTTCDTAAKQVAHAVQRAQANGVAIRAADVTITPEASCGGATGALLVQIRGQFASPVRSLLPFPATVEGAACMPKLGGS